MLNPDRSVILTAAHAGTRVLIGLHPQPGKYEVYLPPNTETGDGTKWDFGCPVCQDNLATEEDANLCELELWVDEKPLRILFSSIAGEHATFVVRHDTVEEKHGKDAARYSKLWSKNKFIR
jgi:hypothetical protein